ncbi:MAG: DUF4129 domain-containing protein [Firmicutes bacterium]|nr:DUF4129 domain-containing protein [Bacillota bacterium]
MLRSRGWITLAAAVMELGAWYPWALLAWAMASGGGGGAGAGSAGVTVGTTAAAAPAPPSPWWFLIIFVAGAVTQRLVPRMSPNRQDGATVAAGAAIVLAAGWWLGPPRALSGFFAFTAFWRGLTAPRYAGDEVSMPETALRLMTGLVILAGISALPNWHGPFWLPEALPYMILAFTAALLGLSLNARTALNRRTGQGQIEQLRLGWPVLLTAASLLLLAVGAAWAAGAGAGAPILALILWMLRMIGAAIIWLFSLAVWVLQYLFTWLQRLLGDLEREIPRLEPEGFRLPEGTWDALPVAPEWLALLPKLFLGLSIAAIAAALLLLALRRRRQGLDTSLTGSTEERHSLFRWGRLFAALRPRRRRRRMDIPPRGPAGRVRALFRRLQRLGAARGLPRHSSQTPASYGRQLAEQALPGPAGPTIAKLYEQVRYGEREPDPKTIAETETLIKHRTVK